MSQAGLALALGTSQSTISKILSARQCPRPALRAAALRFIGEAPGTVGLQQSELMTLAQEAFKQSASFRALLLAAVNLVNGNE